MGKTKLYAIISVIFIFSFLANSHSQDKRTERKKAYQERKAQEKANALNVVPTISLASTIGEGVLKEKYGEAAIEAQKPFSISLENEIWLIQGKENADDKKYSIQISKVSGTVLAIGN